MCRRARLDAKQRCARKEPPDPNGRTETNNQRKRNQPPQVDHNQRKREVRHFLMSSTKAAQSSAVSVVSGNHHGSSNVDQALVKPTEAQLRWAQFHHKRVAIGVRESINALHELPETLESVPGALPEDAASSSSGGSDTIRAIRKKRPKISRGRRALLRVSRRAWERRRQAILEHGYQGMIVRVSKMGTSDDENENGDDPRKDSNETPRQDFKTTGDRHEDALNEIFMVKSSRKRGKLQGRRRRRQARKGAKAKDESFKRFQAACHAMMMNLTAPPKQSIIIPTKIWTRSVDAAAALDSEYLDPKWGIRRRTAADALHGLPGIDKLSSQNFAPMDRGASWMMHLPKGTSTARENPYYHDPSSIHLPPPSPGSAVGSESQFSAASTLALQAPGAQKFNQLVALVQQRMIERRQEAAAMEERRESDGPTPTMRLRRDLGSASSTTTPAEKDNHEEFQFQNYDRTTDDTESPSALRRKRGPLPFSPNSPHVIQARKSRKAHFVPRMHLRDFIPAGAALPEEYQDETPGIELDSDSPIKMRLREHPPGQEPKEERRRSRAQELAESFEPKDDKEGRLSRTQQMAQSFEANQPKHPTMRLRPSIDFEGDEKKLSEDTPTPGRISEAMSEPFLGSQSTDEVATNPPRHSDPTSSFHSKQKTVPTNQVIQAPVSKLLNASTTVTQTPNRRLESIGENDDRLLVEPPKRRNHPLSGKFVEAIQTDQQSSPRPHIMIQPLPPGTCCSRCSKASPLASGNHFSSTARSSLDSSHPSDSKEASIENGKTTRESTDFFSQVRQMNPKAAGDRVSDFFGQLRQAATSQETKGATSPNRESIATTGSNRMSDFFAKVRSQFGDDSTSKNQETSTATPATAPAEDSDFFNQVRQMMSTDDDDEETANQRVSDFFAQVRQLSHDDNDNPTAVDPSTPNKDGQVLLCEDCQVEDIMENMESASVTVSPVHGSKPPGVSPSRNSDDSPADVSAPHTPKEYVQDSMQMEDRGVEDEELQFPEDMAKEKPTTSPEANQAANGVHDQQEAQPSSNEILDGVEATKLSSKGVPSRVGGFLEMLQGKKEQEERELQAMKERRLNNAVQGQVEEPQVDNAQSKLPALDYDSDNDLAAMAAYRKSQESRKLSATPDDVSSTSSFQPLPDAFRDVVKQVGSSPKRHPPRPKPLHEGKAQNPQEVVGVSSPTGAKGMDPPQLESLSRKGEDPPTNSSPITSKLTSSALEQLSSGKYKEAHDKVMASSPLRSSIEQDIIDTDATTSDASFSGLDPSVLANLMLSPDLLQKRLHQAIMAIEAKQWEQVKYLLKANPWLAEMCELTTNQYLLHKLAFFGTTAPLDICQQLIDMFPAAVHKFDQDGNVPLHLAAAAGHLKMIQILGEKFKGGASIRNEDGMLPLHFTIASYSEHNGKYDDEKDDQGRPSPLLVIKTVLKFFPAAVAITDNDGNLPIHITVECLNGGLGVDVIYMLLDEADRELKDPNGARFRNKLKLEELVNDDISTLAFQTEQEFDMTSNEDVHCNVVKNDFGETPLLAAIRGHKGWEIIEALASGPGGTQAALLEDANKSNALHLLLDEFQDPAAAMSILRMAPSAVRMRNSDGMLPIEIACFQLMPEEVILAIALMDLPFHIDDKEANQLREGSGGSWWFLACDCDDTYTDIIQEIVIICSFQQIRALCYMEGGSNQNKSLVMDRATPKCRDILTHALRFLGRFEIIGDEAIQIDDIIGLKTFNARDFADVIGIEDGRRVVLHCYSKLEAFNAATVRIRSFQLDPVYVEEVQIFGDPANQETTNDEHQLDQQHCISIEAPQLTLNTVVEGMVRKGAYADDKELRRKYAAKMCAVLRLIAKSLRHLHGVGVIHGNLCMETCGKFEHAWKLLDRKDVQAIGMPFDPTRFQKSFPPESLQINEANQDVYDSDNPSLSFCKMTASSAIDIWAFGKLAYETLVGKALVEFDPNKRTFEDGVALLEIMEWEESNMRNVFTDLLNSGVTESCAELVTSCLFPDPGSRPESMEKILEDPFWKDMRQFRQRSSKHRGDAASSVYTDTSPKSIFTETASQDYDEGEV